MTEEEKKAKKKAAQAAAWQRWYKSDKGKAYNLKRKMREPAK